ncbi:MAG: sensor histidine kinase [Stellaceae bacterium]
MRFYLLLNRLGWPRSYLGKILTISFVGVHLPMIGTVIWILLGTGLPMAKIWTVLAAMLAATLIGTAATLACLYALLKPVAVASHSISAYLGAKTVPSLPTTLKDEVGVLMASIQEGVTRLDAAIDAANSRASEATREKRERFRLLSGLSHEFRTPLNHIIGFAEMMSNEALGPIGKPTYKEYAGDIGSSGGELLSALQTVLDLSQAEADTLDIERQDLSLAGEVEAVLALLHLEAERDGRELHVQLDGDARIVADSRLMKQILLHGVRAAMAGPRGAGLVTIESAAANGRCTIDIVHEGAPWLSEDLPDDLRDRVADTQSYSTTDAAMTNPHVSRTALHLALVQSLVRTSAGDLDVSATPDGGRQVRIILPMDAPTAPVTERALMELMPT